MTWPWSERLHSFCYHTATKSTEGIDFSNGMLICFLMFSLPTSNGHDSAHGPQPWWLRNSLLHSFVLRGSPIFLCYSSFRSLRSIPPIFIPTKFVEPQCRYSPPSDRQKSNTCFPLQLTLLPIRIRSRYILNNLRSRLDPIA